jgi:hypothetical protein
MLSPPCCSPQPALERWWQRNAQHGGQYLNSSRRRVHWERPSGVTKSRATCRAAHPKFSFGGLGPASSPGATRKLLRPPTPGLHALHAFTARASCLAPQPALAAARISCQACWQPCLLYLCQEHHNHANGHARQLGVAVQQGLANPHAPNWPLGMMKPLQQPASRDSEAIAKTNSIAAAHLDAGPQVAHLVGAAAWHKHALPAVLQQACKEGVY